MNSKILLLTVAVIAVGLFALPSTMSLFTGQHTFYDGANVSCKKCHQDIYDEIGSDTNRYQAHYSKRDCSGCHKTTTSSGANISNNSWRLSSKGTVIFKAHAAVTVECLACHGRQTGEKEWGVAEQIQSASEAHRQFYWQSVSDKDVGDINQTSIYNAEASAGATWDAGQGPIGQQAWYTKANQTVIQLKGANTACIGCHTHAVVNITWRRSIGYEVTADTTSGDFVLSDWAASASYVENTTSNS